MQVLQVQLEVGADPAEVGRARRWARSLLAGSGIHDDEPVAETLILIVSELVTNAVVHTGSPAVLRLRFWRETVRAAGGADSRPGRGGAEPTAPVVAPAGGPVAGDGGRGGETQDTVRVDVEVADSCASPPRPRCASGEDMGGRGLELVGGLADRWGWQPEGAGKRVWCEVDRSEKCASAAVR